MRRHDRGDALGEHRFAGTGRAEHEEIVAARHGHFDGPLDVMLAAHVAEIDLVVLVLGEELLDVLAGRQQRLFSREEFVGLAQIVHTEDSRCR